MVVKTPAYICSNISVKTRTTQFVGWDEWSATSMMSGMNGE